MYVLGVDIGGTWVRTGFVDAQGTLTSFKRVLTKDLFSEGEGLDGFVDYLKKTSAEIQIKAISIGVPATVNRERTKVLSATFLHALDGVDIVQLLNDVFHVPVYLERDVNFLLMKDLKEKNIVDFPCICAIYYGTGIGNAIYINGNFLVGKHGVAAELGHIPLYQNTNPCGCGNIGCVESTACGRVLQHIHNKKYPSENMDNIFTHYQDDEDLQLFVDTLGLVAATEINLLDPDLVVVGGGLPTMKGFPKDVWEKAVYKYARKPFPADDLNFLYTGDSQESGVIGGGLYAWNKLIK